VRKILIDYLQDPYFSGHALVPNAQIVCIEVLEAISESNLSFVLPSVVEPVEESDEESIEGKHYK
jgi:hypothetical protein